MEAEALARLGLEHPTPKTPEALDEAVRALKEHLQAIAESIVPKRKGGPPGRPLCRWWSSRATQASVEVKRAQRRHSRERTIATQTALDEAIRARRKTFRQDQGYSWRETLGKASQDSGLLWKLEKWARLRSHRPSDPPKIPPLYRDNDDLKTATPAVSTDEKTQAFQKRFFPTPQADHRAIEDPTFQDP